MRHVTIQLVGASHVGEEPVVVGVVTPAVNIQDHLVLGEPPAPEFHQVPHMLLEHVLAVLALQKPVVSVRGRGSE